MLFLFTVRISKGICPLSCPCTETASAVPFSLPDSEDILAFILPNPAIFDNMTSPPSTPTPFFPFVFGIAIFFQFFHFPSHLLFPDSFLSCLSPWNQETQIWLYCFLFKHINDTPEDQVIPVKVGNSDPSQASVSCHSIHQRTHFRQVTAAGTLDFLRTECICTADFFASVFCLLMSKRVPGHPQVKGVPSCCFMTLSTCLWYRL